MHHRQNAAKEIKIPRCVYDKSDLNVTECFLHGFGDASKAAYSAVIYLVYKTQNGCRNVRMLASKSRVAPRKALTIRAHVGQNRMESHLQ